MDCRGGEINGTYFSLWEPVNTFFGKCLRFSTDNLHYVYPGEGGVDQSYNEMQMNIIAGYNDTDWVGNTLSNMLQYIFRRKDGLQCSMEFHFLLIPEWKRPFRRSESYMSHSSVLHF